MNKTIRLEALLKNIYRLDKATYWNWEGCYGRAIRLEATAKRKLGDAFEDVVKARINAAEMTGETTYKPICDRLRAMGYNIVKNEDKSNGNKHLQ